MSDHKLNEQYGEMDAPELMELLQRLKRRDQLLYNGAPDLILSEETEEWEEDLHLDPIPYQPELILAADGDEDIPDREVVAPLMPNVNLQDLLLFDNDEETDELQEQPSGDALPPPPANRRNPFAVLWGGFCSNFPRRGDSTGTKVRKCGFLTSLLVMLAAIIYLVVDLLVIPAKNEKLKQELIAIYHPEKSEIVLTKEETEEGNYPEKMLASFTDLYDRNDDVRGWISFHATGNKDFLDIEYPIVYSGDNTEYLRKDYDGKQNRNGTLFFDQNNKVNSYKDENRSLIVYGHNMASGQMFAGLNKFLGSVNNARAAATLSVSTLFRADEYKVFAVILTDESDKKAGRYFNTRRTSFADDKDFLDYIDDMRDRSLFDYPVEVEADDEILVLSTCTGKSSAHVKDGRVVVVARRVRDNEETTVNTSKIVKNKDVIMPYYWYINQKKNPHEYYVQHGLQSDSDLTTQTTTGSTNATSTTVGSATDTTVGTATGTDTTSTDTTGTDVTGSTDGSTTTVTGGVSVGTSSSVTTTGATSSTGSTSGTTSSTNPTSTTQGGGSTTTTGSQGTTTTTGAGEHTHVHDNCEDTTCNDCGETRDPVEHDFVVTSTEEATCGEDGMIKRNCSVCGEPSNEILPATGEHVYDEDGVCTGCGIEKPAEPTEPTE